MSELVGLVRTGHDEELMSSTGLGLATALQPFRPHRQYWFNGIRCRAVTAVDRQVASTNDSLANLNDANLLLADQGVEAWGALRPRRLRR